MAGTKAPAKKKTPRQIERIKATKAFLDPHLKKYGSFHFIFSVHPKKGLERHALGWRINARVRRDGLRADPDSEWMPFWYYFGNRFTQEEAEAERDRIISRLVLLGRATFGKAPSPPVKKWVKGGAGEYRVHPLRYIRWHVYRGNTIISKNHMDKRSAEKMAERLNREAPPWLPCVRCGQRPEYVQSKGSRAAGRLSHAGDCPHAGRWSGSRSRLINEWNGSFRHGRGKSSLLWLRPV